MKTTDKTVRLVWEGQVESDRMCRYYGYLANRLRRRGELLTISVVGMSSGAFVSLMSHFPEWIAAGTSAAAALAGLVLAFGRYERKAAFSEDLYRQMGRLSTEWSELWNGIYEAEDAEVRAAWGDIARRQTAAVDRAPSELPLLESLANRAQQEADAYWTTRYAT